MEEESEVKYCSEFNIALFFIPMFFAVIVIIFSFINLLNGDFDLELEGLAILFWVIAVPQLPLLIFHKRVSLYTDRLEVHNIFNGLRTRIYLKDIRNIRYFNSESVSGMGVSMPRRSYQTIIIITKETTYSYSYITLLNVRTFKAALEAQVNLNR